MSRNGSSIVEEVTDMRLSFNLSSQDKVAKAMEHIGQAFDISRTYVYKAYTNHDGQEVFAKEFEWSADNSNSPLDETLSNNFYRRTHSFGQDIQQLKKGQTVILDMSKITGSAYETLNEKKIASALWVPIFSLGKWWGFIGFDECRELWDWNKEAIDALAVGARAIGAGIIRSDYEHKGTLARQIMSAIDEIYLIHDLEQQCYSYMSDAFSTNWPGDYKEVMFNPVRLFDYVHPDDKQQVTHNFSLRAQGDLLAIDEEFRLIDPSSSIVRWIYARYQVIRINNQVHSIICFLEDISHKKKCKLEAEKEAEKQKNIIIQEVHHRIKNHLQGVCGLLAYKARNQPNLKQEMQSAISQIQAIAVVHELQSKGAKYKITFMALLSSVIDSLQSTEPCHFSQQNLGGQCPCFIEEDETVPLALILNELLLNANQHKSADSDITLNQSCDDRNVILTINNEGILPINFNFKLNQGFGDGLVLLQSLVPKEGLLIDISESKGYVTTELIISKPILIL